MELVGGRRNSSSKNKKTTRRQHKGMGGAPFDAAKYREKRDTNRLKDKSYQRGIRERAKSHELEKNMITLSDGTTLVNNPKTPPFCLHHAPSKPHFPSL